LHHAISRWGTRQEIIEVMEIVLNKYDSQHYSVING
jgi:hypothetical protein